MKFLEALEALERGECVVREKWAHEEGYLKYMMGMTSIWKILIVPAPNAGNYLFTMEDYKAEDWKLKPTSDYAPKVEEAVVLEGVVV